MAIGSRDMTFEDLTSIYRTERGSASLTDVRPDLYRAMRGLSLGQTKECERLATENPESIIFDGALERRRKITYYVKRVTEMRMWKIAEGAMTGAMGANHALDKLTEEEREFYETVVASATKLMSQTSRAVRHVTPDISEPVKAAKPGAPEAYEPESLGDMPVFDDDPIPGEMEETVREAAGEEEEKEETLFGKRVTVRILESLPKFSGPDRDYELSAGDVIRMPAVMAEALVNRGKARPVRP